MRQEITTTVMEMKIDNYDTEGLSSTKKIPTKSTDEFTMTRVTSDLRLTESVTSVVMDSSNLTSNDCLVEHHMASLPPAVDNINERVTSEDKYTDGIELSNACREYYHNRQREAAAVKERLASGKGKSQKSSMDVAMDTLRKEMSSLMEVDLGLMRQLLTLNEAIEDLKSQRDFRSASLASSRDLSGSECSVSDTDMYGSLDDVTDDVFYKTGNTCVTQGNSTHVYRKRGCYEEQNSFDSGTFETY
ncbi:uncharacterized protein LOC128241577 [Mya arenaria]|uniref:uncharacterized protein LOC128241577 n=1 Tax=Mya arenaria TaxID=6604 RepID=UPI0022E364AF|nr:uncharacterized protein LOC128241577 [Mya arenaria]